MQRLYLVLSAIVAAQIPGLLNVPAPANSEGLGDVFNRAWYGSSYDGCQQRQPEPSTTARTDIPYYENNAWADSQPHTVATPVADSPQRVARTQADTPPYRVVPEPRRLVQPTKTVPHPFSHEFFDDPQMDANTQLILREADEAVAKLDAEAAR